MPTDSSAFINMYKELATIATTGEGKLNILHLGDSHIQADYFSGRLRKYFNMLSNGGVGSRGFVFPYNVAKTNNPANYYQRYSGSWATCKNIQRKSTCDFGVGGMNVHTADSNASILFYQRGKDEYRYEFDRIKLFHSTNNKSFIPELALGLEYTSRKTDSIAHYTEFILKDYTDSVKFTFNADSGRRNHIEILGYSFENSHGGITYSATGVNGADVEAWLRCAYLEEQVKTLSPNLVIISLGTNDSYMKYFNAELFAANLKSLIQRIKRAAPTTAIILTTPADNYRYRRYLNKNPKKAESMIKRVAIEENCAIWNLYEIMGGSNSIIYWQRYGLAGRDRLHYTKKGYLFQGDLMFVAILKSFNNYLEKE